MKNMEQDILKVLIEENSIQERVRSLGAQISRDYEGKNCSYSACSKARLCLWPI